LRLDYQQAMEKEEGQTKSLVHKWEGMAKMPPTASPVVTNAGTGIANRARRSATSPPAPAPNSPGMSLISPREQLLSDASVGVGRAMMTELEKTKTNDNSIKKKRTEKKQKKEKEKLAKKELKEVKKEKGKLEKEKERLAKDNDKLAKDKEKFRQQKGTIFFRPP